MSTTTYTTDDAEPDAAIIASTAPTPKTIYFIRHAESLENERLGSIKNAFHDLARLSLPKARDVTNGLQWFNFPSQIDSDVTEQGRQQIASMAETLKRANFLERDQIQLVVHSPLKRARDTCQGILGCAGPDICVVPVQRVLQLDLLIEKTPMEWVNSSSFAKRIKDFEQWLAEQPEERICLVGHSQYFKALLKLDYKFANCDVWKATFHDRNILPDTTFMGEATTQPATTTGRWSNLQHLFACEVSASDHGDKQVNTEESI